MSPSVHGPAVDMMIGHDSMRPDYGPRASESLGRPAAGPPAGRPPGMAWPGGPTAMATNGPAGGAASRLNNCCY